MVRLWPMVIAFRFWRGENCHELEADLRVFTGMPIGLQCVRAREREREMLGISGEDVMCMGLRGYIVADRVYEF